MSQNERKIELDSKFLEEYSELLLKSAVRRYSREQEKEFDALYEEAGKDPECQPSPEAEKRYRRSVKQY